MSSKETQQRYSHPKRKFHDAWAFFLFIIVTISCNAFYIMQKPEKTLIEFKFGPTTYAAIFYVLGCMAAQTLLFLTMPALFMHISFFLSPLLSIGVAIYLQQMYLIIVALIVGAINLFFYFFYYRKHIKYSAAVLRASSKSVVSYSYVIIPTVLFTASLIFAQVFVMGYFTGESIHENGWQLAVLVFQIFWLGFTMIYFGRVFVSSIVALDIITVEEGVSIVGDAFKNSLYCLGSICFGSLIIALISTLKFFHDRNMRNSRDRGLGYVIIQIIIGVLIAMLKNFIEFVNHWALVYMSLYGTKYIDSVKESFDLIMFQRNHILVNNLCLMPVMNVLSESMVIGFLILMYYMLKSALYHDVRILITTIITSGAMFMFNDIYINIFDTATKAFLFSYHKDPVAVKNKYEKTYYMLEEQKYK